MQLCIYLPKKKKLKKKSYRDMVSSKGHVKVGKEYKQTDFYQNVGECVYMKAANISVEWILFCSLSGFTYMIIEMVIENRALSHAVSKAFLMIKCHHISRVQKYW